MFSNNPVLSGLMEISKSKITAMAPLNVFLDYQTFVKYHECVLCVGENL